MATSRSAGPRCEDDKTLELIKHIALNNYGLKLVPKNDYSREKCSSLLKENSDLQQFIREISHVVNFPQEGDPTQAPDMILLETHIQRIMSKYHRLQQLNKKPLPLADNTLTKTGSSSSETTAAGSSGTCTSTSDNSTMAPSGGITRKRKNSDARQDDSKTSHFTPGPKRLMAMVAPPRPPNLNNNPVFQFTIQFPQLGQCDVNCFNVSHTASTLKRHYYPASPTVVPISMNRTPQTVWNAIDKLTSNSSHEIITFRMTPSTDQDSRVFQIIYLYLWSSGGKGGMLGQSAVRGITPPTHWTQVYLVPLRQWEQVPNTLLRSFNGPGLPKEREDRFLLVVVVKAK